MFQQSCLLPTREDSRFLVCIAILKYRRNLWKMWKLSYLKAIESTLFSSYFTKIRCWLVLFNQVIRVSIEDMFPLLRRPLIIKERSIGRVSVVILACPLNRPIAKISNYGAEGPWMPPHSAQLFEVHGDKLLHQNCQV